MQWDIKTNSVIYVTYIIWVMNQIWFWPFQEWKLVIQIKEWPINKSYFNPDVTKYSFEIETILQDLWRTNLAKMFLFEHCFGNETLPNNVSSTIGVSHKIHIDSSIKIRVYYSPVMTLPSRSGLNWVQHQVGLWIGKHCFKSADSGRLLRLNM